MSRRQGHESSAVNKKIPSHQACPDEMWESGRQRELPKASERKQAPYNHLSRATLSGNISKMAKTAELQLTVSGTKGQILLHFKITCINFSDKN